MPNYTDNLRLEKPLQSENYNIDVFNGNADKIDTAIQEIKGKVDGLELKAEKVTIVDIGNYFIDFSTGYWYGIVMIILHRDEKFNWQAEYQLKDKIGNIIKMTEKELHTAIQNNNFKFAFSDNEQIKELGYIEDNMLSKEEFYETDIDNIEWDEWEVSEEENEELLNLLKSQIDDDDEDDDLFELLGGQRCK